MKKIAPIIIVLLLASFICIAGLPKFHARQYISLYR